MTHRDLDFMTTAARRAAAVKTTMFTPKGKLAYVIQSMDQIQKRITIPKTVLILRKSDFVGKDN